MQETETKKMLCNKSSVITFICSVMLLCSPHEQFGRSPLRTENSTIPQLTVCFSDDPASKQSIRKERLEISSLFELFDKVFFENHLLPSHAIAYRNKDGAVLGTTLSELIENLLVELSLKKREFTHFTVLTARNFNKRQMHGLIILKFKNYPFVLKLFIENPESFINPYSKGIEPIAFFYMGGGINRHLMGFTRIKNLEIMQKRIQESPRWANIIVMPRKWFWLPKSPAWLHLQGRFFSDTQPLIETTIPAIYGIVADAIDAERIFSLFNKEDKKFSMEFCNFMEVQIDPHIDNFMIEKNSKKTAIVDTEHFPTLVGLKEKIEFKNYFDWYKKLMGKFLCDSYGYTKKERKALRLQPSSLLLAEKKVNKEL